MKKVFLPLPLKNSDGLALTLSMLAKEIYFLTAPATVHHHFSLKTCHTRMWQ
jgi:hypothetical protein